MLTTKQLEQMNNLEFKKYCEKEYQPFFNYLKQKNIKYSFESFSKKELKGKYIVIKDSLEIDTDVNFTELPSNLLIKDDLDLLGDIKLGKNTIIEGSLILQMFYNKSGLPDDLIVKDCINIYNINTDAKLIQYITITNNNTIDNSNLYPFMETKKISLPPFIIKNVNNIFLGEDVLIENIDGFYSSSSDGKIYLSSGGEECYITDSYLLNKDHTADMNDILPLHDCEEWELYEAYFQNVILYNVGEPIQKKLLLKEFDKITEEEIQKFIHNKNSYVLLKNTLQSNDKINKETIKGKIPLINYCRSKECFDFLQKNNYHFTEEEYNSINKFDWIKGLYQMYLKNN